MLPTGDGMVKDARDIAEMRCPTKSPLGNRPIKAGEPKGILYFRPANDSLDQEWKEYVDVPMGPGYRSKPVALQSFKNFPGAVIFLEEINHEV